MNRLSRRGAIAALAGAGAVFGTTRHAFAFSEDVPTARVLALHENACGATASHKELVAEVDRMLGDKYSADEKKRVLASLTCPVCGCPLAGLF